MSAAYVRDVLELPSLAPLRGDGIDALAARLRYGLFALGSQGSDYAQSPTLSSNIFRESLTRSEMVAGMTAAILGEGMPASAAPAANEMPRLNRPIRRELEREIHREPVHVAAHLFVHRSVAGPRDAQGQSL